MLFSILGDCLLTGLISVNMTEKLSLMNEAIGSQSWTTIKEVLLKVTKIFSIGDEKTNDI